MNKAGIQKLINNNSFRETCLNKENLIDVFIYASGKTGSTSLFESFCNIQCGAMHVHSNKYFVKVNKKNINWKISLFDFINHCSDKTNSKLLIMDIFREPIARKISAFFQHLTRLEYIKKYNFKNENELFIFFINNIDELIELFNDNYLINNEDYYSFKEYRNLGIDIYNYKYDHKNKNLFIDDIRKQYLLLRFDDIKEWETIIRKNTKYNNFTLKVANKTEDKDINDLYKLFKSKYKIPRIKLDKIYFENHSRVLDFFYSLEEKENKYKKWLEVSY